MNTSIQRTMKDEIFRGTILALAAFFTAASHGQNLTIEAESGVISAPFTIADGYIYQPLQTDVTNGGRAVYDFAITNAGSYGIAALVNTPNGSSNSFYVNIDEEPQDPSMTWDILPPTVGFEYRLVRWRGNGTPNTNQLAPKYFSLTSGPHQLIVRGCGADAQLDRLSIVKRPNAPTGLRVVAVP